VGFGVSLSNFNNSQASGTWDLYVIDRAAGDTGAIEGGWTLTVTTGAVDTEIPGTGTSGPAGAYPISQTVSGETGLLTDVDVVVDGLWHQRPDDLDLLLVGPQGQKVVLMSDACGTHALAGYGATFNDDAPAPLPDLNGTDQCLVGQYRPTDHEPGDAWPDPAPRGPYAGALSAFNGTDPNGEWRLYVNDDSSDKVGFFTDRFRVRFDTRPRAPVAFTERAVQVAEGSTRALTLERTGADTLAAGAVTVTSVPAGATSGSDFTPVSTVVEFAAGETRKTVQVDALADGDQEPDETYAVTVGSPTGDAAVGAPSSVAVTIPAPVADPTPAGGQAPLAGPDGAPAAVPGVAGAAAAPGAPTLSGAAVKRRGKGLALEFTLDADASVQATIGQRTRRRKHGRRAALVVRSRQTIAGKAGRNRVPLSTKGLRRGRYSLELVAAAGGPPSGTTRLRFAYRNSRKSPSK
jgi:subtilisin-like proprotein convertase family protein